MGDTEDDEENSDRDTGEADDQSADETDQQSADEADQQCERPSEMSVSLSLDAVLELLANHDRRRIIDYLLDAPRQTATADELVDHLVAQKTELTGERPGHDHVLATLHHVHVPKLADTGVVDYDPRSRQLRYWGNERLETWHRRIRDSEEDPDGQDDGEGSTGQNDEEGSTEQDDEEGSAGQDDGEGSDRRDTANGPAGDQQDDATGYDENDSDRDQNNDSDRDQNQNGG